MTSVVLVTGISGELGLRLAAELAEDPKVDRVIGVDTAPPAPGRLGRVEFVRADIRNPLIAKVIASARRSTPSSTCRSRPRRWPSAGGRR